MNLTNFTASGLGTKDARRVHSMQVHWLGGTKNVTPPSDDPEIILQERSEAHGDANEKRNNLLMLKQEQGDN